KASSPTATYLIESDSAIENGLRQPTHGRHVEGQGARHGFPAARVRYMATVGRGGAHERGRVRGRPGAGPQRPAGSAPLHPGPRPLSGHVVDRNGASGDRGGGARGSTVRALPGAPEE